MTIDDAAAVLDVGESEVQKLLRRGVLRGTKQGRRWAWVDGNDVRKRKRALESQVRLRERKRAAR